MKKMHALTYKTVKSDYLWGITSHGKIPTMNQNIPVRNSTVVLQSQMLNSTMGIGDANKA